MTEEPASQVAAENSTAVIDDVTETWENESMTSQVDAETQANATNNQTQPASVLNDTLSRTPTTQNLTTPAAAAGILASSPRVNPTTASTASTVRAEEDAVASTKTTAAAVATRELTTSKPWWAVPASSVVAGNIPGIGGSVV